MKKFLALLMAAMMLLATAGIAFAEEEEENTPSYSITITNTTSAHTYEAYQIFAGDYADGILSNIVWGENVNGAAYEAKYGKTAAEKAKLLAEDTTMTRDEVAAAFAKEIAPFLQGTPSTGTYSETVKSYVIPVSEEKTGYYLINDEEESLAGTSESYTCYMIQVVGTATISPKVSIPSVEKKVKDTNDSTGETSDWQDSADHDVGDVISYKITGTLPSTLANFNGYKYVFHDTMSAGLTPPAVAGVTVQVVRNVVPEGATDPVETVVATITDKATITVTDTTNTNYPNGHDLTVSFDDLKAAYTELVSTDKIVVEYTCTLNDSAVVGAAGNPNEVYLEYDTNPNVNGTGDSTANTTEDVNIVFTYKVIINKIDPDKKPLAGAEFKLEKLVVTTNDSGDEVETWVEKALTVSSDETSFSATRLDDGIYRLTEVTAPDKYNLLEAPIYFEVTAEHDILAVRPLLTSLVATQVNPDQDYADMTTGQLAIFSLSNSGLTDAELVADIENNMGATLPETGGIGTTLFYLFGSLMTAGSALILVVRRRAEAEEE